MPIAMEIDDDEPARIAADPPRYRRVPVLRDLPTVKKVWMDIYTPVCGGMKVDIRMNLNAGRVELRTRPDTPDAAINLQKSADFVRAFMLGFAVTDAAALLRLDGIHVKSFTVGAGRISGFTERNGRRYIRFIQKSSRTRIVMSDREIHILGSLPDIHVARLSLKECLIPGGEAINNNMLTT